VVAGAVSALSFSAAAWKASAPGPFWVAQLGEHAGVIRVLPLAPARIEQPLEEPGALAQPADRLGGRVALLARHVPGRTGESE